MQVLAMLSARRSPVAEMREALTKRWDGHHKSAPDRRVPAGVMRTRMSQLTAAVLALKRFRCASRARMIMCTSGESRRCPQARAVVVHERDVVCVLAPMRIRAGSLPVCGREIARLVRNSMLLRFQGVQTWPCALDSPRAL